MSEGLVKKSEYRLDYVPTNRAKCKGTIFITFEFDTLYECILNLPLKGPKPCNGTSMVYRRVKSS